MWTTYYNSWHLENAQILPILLLTVYILLLILILRSHGTCPLDEDLVWEDIPYTKKISICTFVLHFLNNINVNNIKKYY